MMVCVCVRCDTHEGFGPPCCHDAILTPGWAEKHGGTVARSVKCCAVSCHSTGHTHLESHLGQPSASHYEPNSLKRAAGANLDDSDLVVGRGLVEGSNAA